MSASVASQNPYDLLGNDIEDPDAPPPPAPRQVIKNTTTSKKRDEKPAPDVAPAVRAGGNKARGRGGNDEAFRDREAGRQNNLAKNTDEDDTTPQGGGRGRGGRRQYDRHSQTGRVDTEKQVGQGWGANKGTKEWDDELAGVELAQKDAAGADSADPNAVPASEDPAAAEGGATAEVPEEVEEVHKTYDEYLAELAQRQADLGPPTEVRRPNEGGNDKKWAAAKEFSREEGAYFVGESRDKTRNRERKTKQILDIEPRYVEPRDAGRGGARGGRGRGGDRGGRGRGERAPRGDRDGDRRGDYRGTGKSSTGTPNLDDTSAFPSLGA
ncbi:hypothetical protein DFP73DRAFT_572360 [Morchella snyderi]|nr:hypothetical protein DFP73DRAFT_572360 [Morchella snyderi]